MARQSPVNSELRFCFYVAKERARCVPFATRNQEARGPGEGRRKRVAMSRAARQSYPSAVYSMDTIDDSVGKIIGKSDWFEVTQADTNAFAAATHDLDRNHIDPDWARDHSPFGGAVAFGFQTLSLLTHLGKMAGIAPAGISEEYNYGLNRVRFPNPVKVGTRVRCILSLKSYRKRPDGYVVITFEPVIEIESEDKPALVAEWLVMVRPENASA